MNTKYLLIECKNNVGVIARRLVSEHEEEIQAYSALHRLTEDVQRLCDTDYDDVVICNNPWHARIDTCDPTLCYHVVEFDADAVIDDSALIAICERGAADGGK